MKKAVKFLAISSLAGKFLIGVVVGTSLMTACAPAKKPPAVSSSAGAPPPDIVIRRSAVALGGISTKLQPSGVKGHNDPAVTTGLNVSNLLQKGSDADSLDKSQVDTATSVIDTIIWQIQTGLAPSSPIDPVVPEGQDPSLTEDALEAAFAVKSGDATLIRT